MNPPEESSTDLLNNHLSNGQEEPQIKTRQELIKRYEAIVYDYLAIMNSSETLKTMECYKFTVQLGLSAITHIYKLAFCMTKNVATSADHCQKGIYCFIEYIEQTQKLGYIHSNGSGPSFDFMDAIVFIYDKTLSDLRGGDFQKSDEHASGSSAFTNILSVSQSHQAHGIDFAQCKVALEQFGHVASILLWFTHSSFSLLDQMEIVDSHLIDFLTYAVSLPSNDLFLFVETVQETILRMEKTEYMDFLSAMKKQIKKQMKRGLNMENLILPACLYVKTFSSGATVKEIAEQEKWKRGVDDLAKLAFQCG